MMELSFVKDCQNIIVGIVYKKNFNWYIADKEIWFLDYKKRIQIFADMGFKIRKEYIDETRKDILILNSDNAGIFLERISDCKISTDELRKLLYKSLNLEGYSCIYEFRPSIYINFDMQMLYSIYSEPASYEDYVPANWKGDFLKIIPIDCRYWIDENSINLFER